VSPSTVSYVLSGKRSISADTRRRVQRSIRELGYHRDARTNTLALVVPLRADLNVAVVMRFVAAAVTTARTHGYDVLVLTKDEGPSGLRRVAASSAALIVMDVESADPRVPALSSLGRPVVLIGVPDNPAGLTCVDVDFEAAGARCVNHLADLGHRTIALLGPPPTVYGRGTSYAGRFLNGFQRTATANRMRATSVPCAPTYEALRTCLNNLLARQRAITGLVVHNEAILGPLLSELERRGWSVPGDVSVLAVCPDDMAVSQAIPLTSVSIPAAPLGKLAVEMVVNRLDDGTDAELRLLPPELTDRGSTRHC